MVEVIGNEKDINSKKEAESNNENYRLFFVRQVENILKSPTDIESQNYLKKYIKKYFLSSFESIENKENYSFFSKNFKDGEIDTQRIENKIEKYLPIHFPVLLKNINKYFDENKKNIDLKNLDKANNNSIKNFIKKYNLIIFIYGEKIKLSELNKLLSEDLSSISNIYDSTKAKIEKINKEEEKSIYDIKCCQLEEKDTNNCKILNRKFLDSTYRNIFKKVILETHNSKEKPTNDIISNKISDEINKLYKEELISLFYIFEKWKDSDGLIGENLINIENTLKKVLNGIHIFKNTDIAFIKEIHSKYGKNNFIDEVFEKLLPKNSKNIDKHNLDLFKEFCKITYKNENNKFDIFFKSISEEKIQISKSKVPRNIEKQNFENLNDATFEMWNKTPEQQKYDIVFNEVLGEEGKIKISEIIDLENRNEERIKLFAKLNNLEGREEVIENQFKEITYQSKQSVTINDFVLNDNNNLNLLILWWRFILKEKELKKENKEINIQNLREIEDKPYGVIEKISKKLDELGLLDSEKIHFNPDGRLVNTSVENISEQLNGLLTAFEKGPIDLGKVTINCDGNKRKIVDLEDLYIPNAISESTDTRDQLENINDWISAGIDLSYKILKGENHLTTIEKQYLNKLVEYGILKNEKYENVTLKQLDNIQDLVETLKNIKGKRKKLFKMFEIAEQDKNNLEGELSKLFKEEEENTIKSGFGAKKCFIRAFKKVIKDYKGNFNRLGDLTRLRIVRKDIDSLIDSVVEFISLANISNEISDISVVDYTGEPVNDPLKKSGYRDIKLLFTVKSGNVVELQFQYDEMLKVKEHGIELEKEDNIFNKLKKEKALLNEEEMKELFKVAKKKKFDLPSKGILSKLLGEGNIDSIIMETGIEDDELFLDKISTTYTYNLVRELDHHPILQKKISRLERTLADEAWAKIVIDYLRKKGIKIS